jgi:hypothetical protein
MTQEDWRPEVNAADYFGAQKKRVAIEQRRPTIRRAADLVGPGIGANAVRITDFNDILATFNGYFSADVGALSAPTPDEAFVGMVVSDSSLGGRQVFTGLVSGTEYSRTFIRNSLDPENVEWSLWTGERVRAAMVGFGVFNTIVPHNATTTLRPPALETIGDNIYEASSSVGVFIRRQGVYTGNVRVGSSTGGITANVTVQRPNGSTGQTLTYDSQVISGAGIHIPFTFWSTNTEQGISVSVLQNSGGAATCWDQIQCTRVGDAL